MKTNTSDKVITIKKKKVSRESVLGAHMYAYTVDFNTGSKYIIKATEEAFEHITRIWKEAKYKIKIIP